MHRCRGLRLWSWRYGKSSFRRSEAVGRHHILKDCLFPTCTMREYSSTVLDNTAWRTDRVVGREARRLALANPTASRHELSQLLIASMESRSPGFALDYFDAYVATLTIQGRKSSTKEPGRAQGPRPTADEYNHWISILMHAPDHESGRGLAKRIYQDKPTRWYNPGHCAHTIKYIASYGRAQIHQNAAQDQSQIVPSSRTALLTTMAYRRDQICSLNMGGLDFLGIRSEDHLPHRRYWTKDEDNRLVDLIINAYINPKEISRWNHGLKLVGVYREMVGSVYLRQLQHASVRYLRHSYPLGYWYGSHRSLKEVTDRHFWIFSPGTRAELNTQFQQVKGTGLRDEAQRDWITDKYYELRRASQDKRNFKKRKPYGELRPLNQKRVLAEDEDK